MKHAFDIVHDNDDFIVVNKKAGVAVHAHPKETLLDIARQALNLPHLHPAHRLDLATSGLIIFTKNTETNRNFAEAFATHQIHKLYIALGSRKPKKKQGKVSGDMAKSRGGSYKLLKSQRHPAITYMQSTGISGGNLIANDTSQLASRLWLLRPVTGKTHQLRVALKALGSPILGDQRYGGDTADRLYLHAHRMKFYFKEKVFDIECMPKTGEYFVDVAKHLAEFGNLWEQGWPAALSKARYQ